ncbi:MAG: protein translocase subunit SecF [Alphaproteobacteria bacterium]
MRSIRFFQETPTLPFMRWRRPAAIGSSVLAVLSLVLAFTFGLNLGIDFRGGTLMEVRTPEPVELGELRSELGGLGLGEVALQEFGSPNDVLIQIEAQQAGGDDAEIAAAQAEAVELVEDRLVDLYGDEVSLRRTEFVGPTVSDELFTAGIMAVSFALVAILVYVWLRFEWQFGVCAVLALAHDVILTVGMFAVTRLEFNLATVAAILTIVGYSLNDTVVVFDRVRDNLRKYKRLSIAELLDKSLNENLSRTLVTSLTTLLALLALFVIAGGAIRGFTVALIWGVLIGTYSSLYIATPALLALNMRRQAEPEAPEGEPAT